MANHAIPTRYDFLDDSVMRRIDYRVARLGRKYCLSVEDRQDIRQEFCLAMFRAGEKYDPERCPPERFVRMVLNRNYKHFVRKLARADENRARSVDTMYFDDVEPDLEYYIPNPKGEDDLRLVDLREDVRTVMKSLPEKLRDICLELMSAIRSRPATGNPPLGHLSGHCQAPRTLRPCGNRRDFLSSLRRIALPRKKTKVERPSNGDVSHGRPQY